MSELRPALRVLFAMTFVAIQLALVLTADLRPDRVFGFRMFNESSSLKFDLYRKVRRHGAERRYKIEDGNWQARTTQGGVKDFSWADRIHYGALTPGVFVHATYGLEAQLYRLQAALEDVAAHTDDDAETLALIARVEPVKNGKPLPALELVAKRR